MLRAVADAQEAFSVDSGSLTLDAVIYAPSNDADSYLATLECVEAFVEGCKKFNENKNVCFFHKNLVCLKIFVIIILNSL